MGLLYAPTLSVFSYSTGIYKKFRDDKEHAEIIARTETRWWRWVALSQPARMVMIRNHFPMFSLTTIVVVFWLPCQFVSWNILRFLACTLLLDLLATIRCHVRWHSVLLRKFTGLFTAMAILRSIGYESTIRQVYDVLLLCAFQRSKKGSGIAIEISYREARWL